jgi:hypothetical protein
LSPPMPKFSQLGRIAWNNGETEGRDNRSI